MMNHKLKYLFRAVYKDGSTYCQNMDDASIYTSGRSCYNDLRLDEIATFTLSDGITNYTLDLSNGVFSINSSSFYLNANPLTDFKLVYFRRVTITMGNEMEKTEVKYVMGYTARDADSNPVTHTIVVS